MPIGFWLSLSLCSWDIPGGLISRLYASTHPKEVAGLVLVDAIPEGVQVAMTAEQ